MLDKLEKFEEPVTEAGFEDQVADHETYNQEDVFAKDDVDTNSIRTCTTNSSTQTTGSIGGSDRGSEALFILLIALLIAIGCIAGIFGVVDKPIKETMLECTQDTFVESIDGQMSLKDKIRIGNSGNTYTSVTATKLAKSFKIIFKGDNKPVFFYGKPGMPIRHILEILWEKKFKQTYKVFWLINIRDSVLRRFDCYKHRAEDFVKEKKWELYLVFADMFKWSRGDEVMKDSLRIILKDWVLNMKNPSWTIIFWESSFEGTKTFMEQLVNAGVIVVRQDNSIWRKTDKKDQQIGDGEYQVIVTEEGAFIDSKGSPLPKFEEPKTWLQDEDIIMLSVASVDEVIGALINGEGSTGSRSHVKENEIITLVGGRGYSWWLSLKRKDGTVIPRVSAHDLVVNTADMLITFVCSLPKADNLYKHVLKVSLETWLTGKKMKFLKDLTGKDKKEADSKLEKVKAKIKGMEENQHNELLYYLGDQVLQMVEDVDSDPNIESLMKWLEKLLADHTEEDTQRIADLNGGLEYIKNIKTGACR